MDKDRFQQAKQFILADLEREIALAQAGGSRNLPDSSGQSVKI